MTWTFKSLLSLGPWSASSGGSRSLGFLFSTVHTFPRRPPWTACHQNKGTQQWDSCQMSRIRNKRKGCSCLRYIRICIRSGWWSKREKTLSFRRKKPTLSLLPCSLPLIAYFACYLHIIYMLFAYCFYYIFFEMWMTSVVADIYSTHLYTPSGPCK